MSDLKDDFLGEVNRANRKGTDELIEYLEKDTDFFTAPASRRYHGSHDEGLVYHSLAVLDAARSIAKLSENELPDDSLVICSLFHDICKANYYVKGKRNVKKNGKWEEIEIWNVKEELPMGHGEKSLYLLMKYGVDIADDEALAIRWHLGGFDPGSHFGFPSGFPSAQTFRQYPLAVVIALADFAASYLLEEWPKED